MIQSIAKENRFSETATVVREPQGWHLRWFTHSGEIDFCGHATLGAAFVFFSFCCPDAAEITFDMQVGKVSVGRRRDLFVMDFPAYECRPIAVTDSMTAAKGVRPIEAYLNRDLLLVLPTEEDVRELRPNLQLVKGLDSLLVAVTAEGVFCQVAMSRRGWYRKSVPPPLRHFLVNINTWPFLMEEDPHQGQASGAASPAACASSRAAAAFVASMGPRFSPGESPSISWSMISSIPSPLLRCRCSAAFILGRRRDIIASMLV